MSYISLESIGFRDDSTVDASGRARVSQNHAVFDSTNEYGINNRDWAQKATGAGTSTFSATEAARIISTGSTAVGDSFVRQSRINWRSFPGRATVALLSFKPGPQVAGAVKRMGYYDAGNGVFLELNGTDVRLVKRTDITGTTSDANYATQANWNIDKLDGTGPSGATLHLDSYQTFFIDILYTTVGRVRCGFVIDGHYVLVHEFISGNNGLTDVWRTPHLPLRAEVQNIGTAATAATMSIRGSCLQIEAGDANFQRGYLNTGNTGIAPLAVTTRRPVLSVRAKALLNGLPNRAWLVPYDFGFKTSSNDIFWEVVVGGTLTGASWLSSTPDSAAEYDYSATAITGGFAALSGYGLSGSGNLSNSSYASIVGQYPTSVDSLNESQTVYTLMATAMSGTANVSAFLNWREVY